MDRREFFLFCGGRFSLQYYSKSLCDFGLFMEDIPNKKWRFESFSIFKCQITQKRELIARNGKRYRNQPKKYF